MTGQELDLAFRGLFPGLPIWKTCGPAWAGAAGCGNVVISTISAPADDGGRPSLAACSSDPAGIWDPCVDPADPTSAGNAMLPNSAVAPLESSDMMVFNSSLKSYG